MTISSTTLFMVFNYLATSFEGSLLENPQEGELLWVHKNEALELPMEQRNEGDFASNHEELPGVRA